MFNFNKKETDSPVNGSVATASPQAPKAALELADEMRGGERNPHFIRQ